MGSAFTMRSDLLVRSTTRRMNKIDASLGRKFLGFLYTRSELSKVMRIPHAPLES